MNKNELQYQVCRGISVGILGGMKFIIKKEYFEQCDQTK